MNGETGKISCTHKNSSYAGGGGEEGGGAAGLALKTGNHLNMVSPLFCNWLKHIRILVQRLMLHSYKIQCPGRKVNLKNNLQQQVHQLVQDPTF